MDQGPNMPGEYNAPHVHANGAQPAGDGGDSIHSSVEPGERVSSGLQSDSLHRLVRRRLYPIHIFLIVISGTIGMGLFDNSGEILNIAGPVGGLIAYIVVGIAAICIMEGIAEMILHWPIANAMVEFVKAFVDRDLAIVVGLAYWYAYSISFASLIIAAANLASYWEWSTILQDFIFIGGVPLALLAINCLGVLWYGNVEAVLGSLKITLVIGSFLTMCIINNMDTGAPTPSGKVQGTYLQDGFQNNELVASSHAIACLVAIPIVAYAYIGVEIVAVTALEAKDPHSSLKHPARLIAWITAIIYFLSALGFYLNCQWTDPLLPSLPGRIDHGSLAIAPSTNSTGPSAVAVIALHNANIPTLPGFINGCLIMAVLSASNTALYVASRTLFGLTKVVDPNDKIWGWISIFSTTTKTRRIPAAALFASAIAFCWVPYLHLNKTYSDQDLQEIMSGIATVAVVLVWGVLCLAYIRYRWWLSNYRDNLTEFPEFNYWSADPDASPGTTILGWAQPLPAYIGLVFCILTIFVFATAGWWNGGEKKIDIYAAFVGPIALFVFWLFLKVLRYGDDFEWYVKLDSWKHLQDRIVGLNSAILTDSAAPAPTTTEETRQEVFEMDRRGPRPSTPSDDQRHLNGVRDSGYNIGDINAEGLGIQNMGGSRDENRTPSPRTGGGGERMVSREEQGEFENLGGAQKQVPRSRFSPAGLGETSGGRFDARAVRRQGDFRGGVGRGGFV